MKFYHCLSLILIPMSILAMEKPAELKKRSAVEFDEEIAQKVAKIESDLTQNKEINLDDMPDEIKSMIVQQLTRNIRGGTLKERLYGAVRNIRSLMKVNKSWKQLIEDPAVNNRIVAELAKQYTNGDMIAAGNALATQTAGKNINRAYSITPAFSSEKYPSPENNVHQKLIEAAIKKDFSTINFLLSSVEHLPQNILNQVLLLISNVSPNPAIVPLVKKLLLKGANINTRNNDGKTALYLASTNNVSLVKLLLEKGANPNDVEKSGYTPLMRAVSYNQMPIVETLLSSGANINAKAHSGPSALTLAIYMANLTMVKRLIRAQAAIDSLDFITVLSSGNIQLKDPKKTILQELVHNAKNLDFMNNKGETPLMYAAQRGDIAAMKIFLKGGAAVNILDNHNHSVLWHVQQSSNPNKETMIKLLKEYGAQ